MRDRRAPRLTRVGLAGLAALVAIVSAVPARAEEANIDGLFEKGNQAYLHGDYAAAIDTYEQVLAAGVVHEDLHYHLGNAYVKADRLGPAILHYERALGLDPSQDDVRHNLKLVREAVAQRWQDRLVGAETDSWWRRALDLLAPGTLALIFLCVYGATFAFALCAYLLRPGFARVTAIALVVIGAASTLGAGALLGGRWLAATRIERGIVLPDELVVKEGPEGGTVTSFLVHAGLRVRMLERDGDWVHIRLENGLEGWTRQRDVGKL